MRAQFYQGISRAPEAMEIRQEVFVREQGFVDEFDDTDPVAAHLLLWDGGKAVATARIFPEQGRPGVWHAGRIAVRKPYRGLHLGAEVMRQLEQYVRGQNGIKIVLSAQMRAKGFYQRCGYTCYGSPYDDEGCPHISMEKTL